jgi:nitrate reductase NapE component
MDKKLKAEILALLLLFAAFPIASFGTTGGNRFVWWIGLISLVAGGLVPVMTRYMDHSADTIRDFGMEYDDRPS